MKWDNEKKKDIAVTTLTVIMLAVIIIPWLLWDLLIFIINIPNKLYIMAQEQGLIKVQDNMSSKIGKKVYYTDPQGNKINGKIKARHSTKRPVFFVVYDCGGN